MKLFQLACVLVFMVTCSAVSKGELANCCGDPQDAGARANLLCVCLQEELFELPGGEGSSVYMVERFELEEGSMCSDIPDCEAFDDATYIDYSGLDTPENCEVGECSRAHAARVSSKETKKKKVAEKKKKAKGRGEKAKVAGTVVPVPGDWEPEWGVSVRVVQRAKVKLEVKEETWVWAKIWTIIVDPDRSKRKVTFGLHMEAPAAGTEPDAVFYNLQGKFSHMDRGYRLPIGHNATVHMERN